MKRIDAIVRETKIDDVKHALKHRSNYMAILSADAVAEEESREEFYRGRSYDVDRIEKAMFVLFVPDDKVPEVCSLIQSVAYTGKDGDGMIIVSDVFRCIKIRDGVGNGPDGLAKRQAKVDFVELLVIKPKEKKKKDEKDEGLTQKIGSPETAKE